MTEPTIESLADWIESKNGIEKSLKEFEVPSVARARFLVKKLERIVEAAKKSQEPGPMQQIEIHATEALGYLNCVISSGEQFDQNDYERIRSRLDPLLQSMEELISDNT